MSFGLVEVITLLLGLSGFGLQPNPQPATADQALQYAMPGPDVVVHVDVTSIIGNNFRLLSALPDQPAIKASAELSRAARRMFADVDGLRGLVKSTVGVDLTTDITDATVFLQLPPRGQRQPPGFLVQVRGKFSLQTIERLGKLVGPPVKVGAAAMIELPAGQFPIGAVAVTPKGVLLAGTTALVKERLADTWKAPARPGGSSLAHAASVVEGRPVAAVVLALSDASRKAVLDDLAGPPNFVTDVVSRHKLAALSIFRDGIGWTWIDSTRPGLDAMTQMSEGAMEMLRAAHIAPRGFAKIAIGALESYRGNPAAEGLVQRKAELWKLVEAFTGDGNFKVAIDKNPATLRLTARATGKSLGEVVPVGLVLPGVAWLVLERSAKPPAALPPAAPARPPATPAKPPKLAPPPPPAPPAPPARRT